MLHNVLVALAPRLQVDVHVKRNCNLENAEFHVALLCQVVHQLACARIACDVRKLPQQRPEDIETVVRDTYITIDTKL